MFSLEQAAPVTQLSGIFVESVKSLHWLMVAVRARSQVKVVRVLVWLLEADEE